VLVALGAAHEAARAAAVLGGQPAPALERQGTSAAGLSRRELQVLALVAEGCSNAEIARRLVLSQHTVHRHVANILTKLAASSRAAAAAYAAHHGLL
jgi:LuxR family transcriptional regulator, maltose regulon positive regulatory protein